MSFLNEYYERSRGRATRHRSGKQSADGGAVPKSDRAATATRTGRDRKLFARDVDSKQPATGVETAGRQQKANVGG